MLNPIHIKARDIPEAWFLCLQAALQHGRRTPIDRGSYEGKVITRLQIDDLTLYITHPFSDPKIPEIPAHCAHIPPPLTPEYLASYIMYFMSHEVQEDEEYTYGSRIWAEPMAQIIGTLKTTPYTNQAVLSISRPSDIKLCDPPCLRSISFHKIEDKLHIKTHWRSWDLYNGLPANINGLLYLWEFVCLETDMEPGEFIANSDGAHIYSDVEPFVKEIVGV